MARAKKRASAKPRTSDKARDTKIRRYRSMVLEKIRNDIEVKRAAIQVVQHVDIPDLGNMGYWKMAYWKMPYWKMPYWKAGADLFGIDEVINPATGIVVPAALQAKLKKRRK
jgi:hypothetical protein